MHQNLGLYSQNLTFFVTYEWAQLEQECHIILGWKGFAGRNTVAYLVPS